MKISASKLTLLLIIIFLASPLYAQSDFSFTYYIIRDDNSFRSRNLYNEWINTFSFYTGYTFTGNSSLLRLYYNGDYSTFTNYKDRQNNAHIFGIAGIPFKSKDITINLGASANIRRNKGDYTYYDVNSYSFYANFRYEPELTKTGRIIRVIAFNLTWDGHEFLDAIRNEGTWNKIKAFVKEKSASLSFDVIKAVALHGEIGRAHV